MRRWEILIAHLASRGPKLMDLLTGLLPKVDAAGGEVKVTTYRNHGERPLGEIRQALVENSDAEYISFVDDDDVLPDYFVPEILPLLDGVDQIGWRMQTYIDGNPLKPTFHSVRYKHWYEDNRGYYRDVSHLNPIRRDIAIQADFRRGAPPEDVSWSDQVRGLVHTEHFIDRVMYHYYHQTNDTTWERGVGARTVKGRSFERPEFDSPHFSYHPEST